VLAFVFGACLTVMMRLLGMGADWRGMDVGWGLSHVRKLALADAMFAIGVAACNGGGVLRGVGWAYSFCNWDLSLCNVYYLVLSDVGSRCVAFSLP